MLIYCRYKVIGDWNNQDYTQVIKSIVDKDIQW
jgi:hypothetical protein